MTISIVSATYNHKNTLPLLYESIKSQENYVKEFIICDDGSTDGTWDLIKYYELNAPFRVKGFHQENKGMRLARNINQGLKDALGDVIFIVMGDSYLQPDTLKELFYMYRDGSAGSGMRVNVDQDGSFISYDWRVPNGNSDVISVSDKPNPWIYLTGNSMIISKIHLEKIGYWDERYEGYGKDDWDVFMQLHKLGVPLYQYNNVKINHIYHGEGQPDNPANTSLFQQKYENLTRLA